MRRRRCNGKYTPLSDKELKRKKKADYNRAIAQRKQADARIRKRAKQKEKEKQEALDRGDNMRSLFDRV